MPSKTFISASIKGLRDSSTEIFIAPDVALSVGAFPPPPEQPKRTIPNMNTKYFTTILLSQHELHRKNEAYFHRFTVLFSGFPWGHFLNNTNSFFIATRA